MGYKLKKNICILFIVIFLLFDGCERENNYYMTTTIYNIPINNTIKISEINFVEYSLFELNNYFGEYSEQEKSVFNCNNQEKLNIQKVNNIYPIQIIRKNEDIYYSIYKVKEAGYYYVFWLIDEINDCFVTDTFYINKLKEFADFNSLKMGISTYEDVYSIDSASELILMLSNGIYSYSLLKDNKLLQIEYDFEELNHRRDLIISNIEIIKSEKPFVTKLSYIYSKDLL